MSEIIKKKKKKQTFEDQFDTDDELDSDQSDKDDMVFSDQGGSEPESECFDYDDSDNDSVLSDTESCCSDHSNVSSVNDLHVRNYKYINQLEEEEISD